jgi:hypothetical protein
LVATGKTILAGSEGLDRCFALRFEPRSPALLPL